MKKLIVTFSAMMLMSTVLFAQQVSRRATVSTTTTNRGSCVSTSSATSNVANTNSTRQGTQSLSTPAALGTKAKATTAVLELVDILRSSRSVTRSTGIPGAGVQLPDTVVPFH